MYDVLDPLLVEAFRNQPPELPPLTAFRKTLREVLGTIPPGLIAQQEERAALMEEVPELRARMLEELLRGVQLMGATLAERTGRPPDDFRLRVTVGAVAGVMIGLWFVMPPHQRSRHLDELMDQFDRGLALLEDGLPL